MKVKGDRLRLRAEARVRRNGDALFADHRNDGGTIVFHNGLERRGWRAQGEGNVAGSGRNGQGERRESSMVSTTGAAEGRRSRGTASFLKNGKKKVQGTNHVRKKREEGVRRAVSGRRTTRQHVLTGLGRTRTAQRRRPRAQADASSRSEAQHKQKKKDKTSARNPLGQRGEDGQSGSVAAQLLAAV